MNARTLKILAIVIGLAGLVALITGIGGFEYSFKTGHWSRFEDVNPTGARIVGAVLVGMAIFLFRQKPGKPDGE
ncbi:MAG: hypothetical protein DMG89_11575 [Acidobacteria bacterium]|nr:MAG: hypothetical protein DMG89_11575 [Acidobacteriota bacterium]